MSYGLLPGAYRTFDDFLAVRSYVRQRETLVQDRSCQVQHLQKALSQMNVQVDNFLSDVMCKSGSATLRAIEVDERNPEVLASLSNSRVNASPEQLAESLEGNWREEHLQELASALRQYDFFGHEIYQLEQRIDQHLNALEMMAVPKDEDADENPKATRELQQLVAIGRNATSNRFYSALPGVILPRLRVSGLKRNCS